MKFKKVLSVLALMAAFTVTACNGGAASEEPASEQPAATSQPAAKSSDKASSKAGTSAPASSSKAASQPASSSKAASSNDDANFLNVIAHTWTDGTPAANSDGKNYIPLTDTAANKVGVKIAITDYTLDSSTTATGMGNDGKINPGNDHGAYLTYKVKAPKAGAYQMVLRGKSSTSNNALEKSLDDRAFGVTLNGQAVNTYGDRVVLTADNTDFVGAPTVMLTGNEDTFTITASDYRIQFDVASFIIFAEH